MRRFLFFTIIILFALSWTGTVAAAPKPPKSICLNWAPDPVVTIICTKPMGGKIKALTGPTKFYEIHGEMVSGTVSLPLSGAGHLQGTTFHFQLTGGGVLGGTDVTTYTFEGTMDLSTNLGTGRAVRYGPSPGGNQFGPYILTPVNCATTPLPYAKGGTAGAVTGGILTP